MNPSVPSGAPPQSSAPLLVATCRANPESRNLYDNLPMLGGDYKLAWAYPLPPSPDEPIHFKYTAWQKVVHSKRLEEVARVLPPGDVLVVVHGFNDTAPQGVHTGQALEEGLDGQRTGGVSVALGAQKPMGQSSALRLAKTLHNEVSPSQALYQYMIAFTWPCAHRVFPGYLLDKEEVARFAAFSLANLLADLRTLQPNRRILLVAHSMGCFLTIKALNMLALLRSTQAPQGASPVIVDQMVFYAADVNCDALETGLTTDDTNGSLLAPSSSAISRRRNGYGYQALDRVGRLTIYHSFHDNVLIWSPFANFLSEESAGGAGRARLGWCGPLHIEKTHKNVVAVDCSHCVYDHSGYFVRHEVLEHTAGVLREAAPAPNTQQPVLAEPLRTSAQGGQKRAHRMWTWYTPAEIARERWERLFYRQHRWLRRIGLILGTLICLGMVAGLVFGLLALLRALIG